MASWDQLKALASARCTHLTFTVDAFAPLNGHPFVSGAAQRLLFVLDTLNHFKSCFDVDGQRTPEGHEIYRDYFTGRKGDGGRGPLFTDSSDDEKRTFETEMTFKHPTDANKTLFCPVAREGSDAAATRALFLAGSSRRATLHRVRGAEDHQEIACTQKEGRAHSRVNLWNSALPSTFTESLAQLTGEGQKAVKTHRT